MSGITQSDLVSISLPNPTAPDPVIFILVSALVRFVKCLVVTLP